MPGSVLFELYLIFIAMQSLLCDQRHSASIVQCIYYTSRIMPIEVTLLDQFSFLKDLPVDVRHIIAKNAQVKRFPAQHTVLPYHSSPAFLAMVLRGQLQMTEVAEDGRITAISLVNSGQVLDWLSVVDGLPIICSISTTQESDLLLLPIGFARDLVRSQQLLSSYVLSQLARNVRRATEQRQILTLPNAFQRIFVQIIQLAEQSEPHQSANLPKQHEIAAMVNTSRETVSRAIQMLVKNGILTKNGHRFLIQGPDQLRRLAAMSNNPINTVKN